MEEIVQFIPPSQRRMALLATQADNAPVLIHGSSGTGKGALARWVHKSGPRASLPFEVATRDISLAEQLPKAQGGTFLIPEIGEWPLAEQKILLDFLEKKSIPCTPENQFKMLLNVRIMATTSQALEGRAQGGLFNLRLFEKLNVFRLEMPPLTQRFDEFEEIARSLTEEITRELHKEHLRELSPETWERLRSYDWPGNLRELRNVLRIAVLNSKGDRIEVQDLPDFGHDRLDFRATRQEFEKIYLLELLKTFDWQIDTTCRMTRMDQKTLVRKIQQYGLTPPEVTIP